MGKYLKACCGLFLVTRCQSQTVTSTGLSLIKNEGSTSLVHKAHSIKIPPTTANDGADSEECMHSWVSYVKADISAYYAHKSMESYSESHFVGVSTTNVTKTISSMKPLITPAPTECDGNPRVQWLGETLEYNTTITEREEMLFNWEKPSNKTNYYQEENRRAYGSNTEKYGATPNMPNCKIRPDDCEKQWSSLLEILNKWDATFWNSTTLNATTLMKELKFSQYPKVKVDYLPFFGNCPQPQTDLCIEPLQLSTPTSNGTANETSSIPFESVSIMRYKEAYQCRVDIDQFVIIHWPLPSVISRDLCANHGYGTQQVISTETGDTNKQVFATLSEITFRSRRSAQGEMHTSIMSGLWTFTSPSVYLAYGTISAWASCSRPTNTYKNSILALRPTELSSLVVQFSAFLFTFDPETPPYRVLGMYQKTARPYNLYDLDGPPPASAFIRVATESAESKLLSQLYSNLSAPTGTIMNGYYYPLIDIPARAITELDPAFAECTPIKTYFPMEWIFTRGLDGVYDPPITLSAMTVESIAPVTLPQQSVAQPTNGPKAGAKIDLGEAPSTALTQNIPHINTLTLSIGAAEMTASLFPENQALQIGSITLSAGGPAQVMEDENLSLDSNGILIIGSTRTIHIADPAETAVKTQIPATNIDMKDKQVAATLFYSQNSLSALEIGSQTIQVGGVPTSYEGRNIMLDSHGVLVLDGTAIATIPTIASRVGHTASSNKPSSSSTGTEDTGHISKQQSLASVSTSIKRGDGIRGVSVKFHYSLAYLCGLAIIVWRTNM